MPWVVGIDEAGYGPNLGPLVQAAVAVKLPEDELSGWSTLGQCVRTANQPDDGRVLVDDSKKVYAGVRGLEKLELGISAVLGKPQGPLADWLRTVGLPGVGDDLAGEPWYQPGECLPLFRTNDPVELPFPFRLVAVNAVSASLFNRVVAGSNSKATVLTIGLVELLRRAFSSLDAEPLEVFLDKQGGRNFYGPILQAAFPSGWPVAERESPEESRYRVEALDRPVRVTVRPQADSGNAAVALASMVAKYVREVSMRQFNRFWTQLLPDLTPTAGYPVDARRYFSAILPVMERLQIPEDRVWRCR